MNRYQVGMVLLTTMMMIGILTMLILTLMQGVLLYIKANNQIVSNHRLFHQMEATVHKLNLHDPACTVQDKNPNELFALLAAHQGCKITDGTRQYAYLLGDLGLFPCLQMVLDEARHGSRQVLVTMASMQPPNLALQLRIALLAETAECGLSISHQIHPGVMSWRSTVVAKGELGIQWTE